MSNSFGIHDRQVQISFGIHDRRVQISPKKDILSRIIHPIVRLRFFSSRKYEVPLYCHYSQIHPDPMGKCLLRSALCVSWSFGWKDWLIQFNGIKNHLVLFYVKQFRNRFHCTSIFTYFMYIYIQPLYLGIIWHKVNFKEVFSRFEFGDSFS